MTIKSSLYQSQRFIHHVEMIEDSIAPNGQRLTTMQLTYWRAIHAEFMTHRVFSRNASSSRAIPVAKLLEQVREQPAGPIMFLANQPGMQGGEVLSSSEQWSARDAWETAARRAADQAEQLMKIGVHKQFANRLLEPFTFIKVIVTATDWANFFELRCHPDAQPEIHELAQAMDHVIACSTPKKLHAGEWHLPYIREEERTAMRMADCVKASAARCARVSYLTHDKKEPSLEADLKLYHQLAGATPIHASPLEHQAQAMDELSGAHRSGNFVGWYQYRKMIERGWKV